MGGPCLVDGVQRAELDNFLDTDGQFTLDGKVWSSAEQYYQAAKFQDDDAYQEVIRACRDGLECWKLGSRE